MTKQTATYKITNWHDYNQSLIQRGNINLWFSQESLNNWRNTLSSHKKGRPHYYSKGMIELCLMVKYLYRLTYRATQGYMQSIFSHLKVDIPVPSYTQMSRRASKLELNLTRVFKHKGPIDIVVDSTGLKVYGEGEWKVRKHGAGKHRTWRKLHLVIDPVDHEIVAAILTDNAHSDGQVFPKLVKQIDDKVERCFGDGAYDQKGCYKSAYKKQMQLITPPKRGAKAQADKVKVTKHLKELEIRDQSIQRIATLMEAGATEDAARQQWKFEQDYHCRSLGETAMLRFKSFFGDKLTSRTLPSQITEMQIKVNLMNRMTALGMPITRVVYQ